MEKAFQRQVLYGGSLDTILLELGMVPEDRLCQYLALASGLPPAARAETEALDPSAVALLSLDQAQSYRAVPISLEGDALRVAVAAPIDLAALEDLADHVDRPLRPLLVPEYRWHLMLEQAYGVPTPQRFAALANQIEKDNSSQPVGRSRTVIVDNEPERDIVANAQTMLPQVAEPSRPRTRTTEDAAPRVEAAPAPTPAALAPRELERASADPELVHEAPTPTETVQGISMRRRATLIGVSPVRALTDEPLHGDLLPSQPSSTAQRPGSDAELEAAERRGPLYEPTYDDRPTSPRRAQLSPEERAALRNQDTRPIARRRPSPESLASISAASLASLDEAAPLDDERSDERPSERQLSRTALAPRDEPPAPRDEPAARRADTWPEPLPATARSTTNAPPRRTRPDTLDTTVQEVPAEAAAPSARAKTPSEPVPEAVSAHAPESRSGPRASTQPVQLPSDPGPISAREARELLTNAEHRDDVFFALMRAMRHVAHWVGLLTVHGGAAIGRVALAHPTLDADKIGTVLIPLDAPSPVRTAMTSKRPYVGPLAKGDPAVDSMFLRMGDVRPPSLAVIPIVLRDRVVAMIVGHRGAAELTFSDVAEILPLAALASDAIGRLIVRQKSTAQTGPIPSGVAPARPSSPGVAPARPSSPSVAPARPSSPRPARATPAGAATVLPALPSYAEPSAAQGATRAQGRQATTPAATVAPDEPEPEPGGEPARRAEADPDESDDERAPTRPFAVVPEPAAALGTPPLAAPALRPASASTPPPLTAPAAGSVPLAATPAPLTIDELLELIEQRKPAELEAAMDEAIARAAEILPALAARFPGELDLDRYATTGRPLRAAQYGGLLELVTRLGPIASELIIDKMSAPARDVRFYATVCATELRPRNALGALIERLFDVDLGVRACAIEALQGYPVRDLAAGLTRVRQALHSDDAQRMAAAANAAVELSDRDAVPDLIAALGRGARFAETARGALLALTAQDLGTSERKWQKWWDDHQRRHRVEWLIDGLLHKEPVLRAKAIGELRRITGESFGYDPEAPRKERELSHRRWLTWWSDVGQARLASE